MWDCYDKCMLLFRYDPDGKGRVTFDDFLNVLTAEKFAPGDQEGTSNQVSFSLHIYLCL